MEDSDRHQLIKWAESLKHYSNSKGLSLPSIKEISFSTRLGMSGNILFTQQLSEPARLIVVEGSCTLWTMVDDM